MEMFVRQKKNTDPTSNRISHRQIVTEFKREY